VGAVRRAVLGVRGGARDAALPLLRRLVDRVERTKLRHPLLVLPLRDRRRPRRLAVVHVTDRPHVHVRLLALELALRHALAPSSRCARSPGPALRAPGSSERTASCTWRAPASSSGAGSRIRTSARAEPRRAPPARPH